MPLRIAEIYVGILAATILVIATNAGVIGASRITYSMATYRQLPEVFRRLHPRFKTPWLSLVAVRRHRADRAHAAGRRQLHRHALLARRHALVHRRPRVARPHALVDRDLVEVPYRARPNVRIGSVSWPVFAIVGGIATGISFLVLVVQNPLTRWVGLGWMAVGLVGYAIYRRRFVRAPVRAIEKAPPALGPALALEYRNLLVPVIPGQPSDAAMDVACRLASERRARIIALNVLEVPLDHALTDRFPELEYAGNAELDEAAAIGDSYGVRVLTRLERAHSAGPAIVAEATRGTPRSSSSGRRVGISPRRSPPSSGRPSTTSSSTRTVACWSRRRSPREGVLARGARLLARCSSRSASRSSSAPPRAGGGVVGYVLGALFIVLGVARFTLERQRRSLVARKLRGFERVIDAPSLFAIAYGEIASSLYIALGIVAGAALGFTPLVLLVTGAIFLLVSLSYAEGTAALPETGGAATFVRRAFNDLAGFVTGWVLFLDFLIVMALSAVFVPHYLAGAFGTPSLRESPWDAIIGCLIIVVIAGVRLVRRTRLHLGAFVGRAARPRRAGLLLVLGLAFLLSPSTLVHGFGFADGQSWTDLAFALPLAMLAYTGLETIANLAEEAREPGRDLPRALFSAIGLVVVVTVLIGAIGLSAYPVLERQDGARRAVARAAARRHRRVARRVAAVTARRRAEARGRHLRGADPRRPRRRRRSPGSLGSRTRSPSTARCRASSRGSSAARSCRARRSSSPPALAIGLIVLNEVAAGGDPAVSREPLLVRGPHRVHRSPARGDPPPRPRARSGAAVPRPAQRADSRSLAPARRPRRGAADRRRLGARALTHPGARYAGPVWLAAGLSSSSRFAGRAAEDCSSTSRPSRSSRRAPPSSGSSSR